MSPKQGKRDCREIQMLVQEDRELLRELVRAAMQEVLEAEMDEALGARKGERTAARLGYRSGHYGRSLTTRVGTLELRVPQDRHGLFSTELFERYQLERESASGRLERDVRARGLHAQGGQGDSRSSYEAAGVKSPTAFF